MCLQCLSCKPASTRTDQRFRNQYHNVSTKKVSNHIFDQQNLIFATKTQTDRKHEKRISINKLEIASYLVVLPPKFMHPKSKFKKKGHVTSEYVGWGEVLPQIDNNSYPRYSNAEQTKKKEKSHLHRELAGRQHTKTLD